MPRLAAETSPAMDTPADANGTQQGTSNQSSTPALARAVEADKGPAPMPSSGATSFTETEARTRLTAHGYSDISGLAEDSQSIWRATAMMGGKTVKVALDYRGFTFND